MLEWIDEVMEAKKEYWAFETDYARDIKARLKGWESKSLDEQIELANYIIAFLKDKSQPIHDRQLIEELTYGFFKFADIY